MKCQKCGAKIPDGDLYCTECGEEINIVPYFEPELETELDENLQRISDDVSGVESKKSHYKGKKKKHYLLWVIFLVIFSMIAALIALSYLYHSPIYHVNRGHGFINQGKYKEAIASYEKALDYEPENRAEVYLYLINCYESLGYDGKYEEYLLKMLTLKNISELQEITIYSKLIKLYRDGNSYQTINNLLKNCKNDKIKELYSAFMVSIPTFSHEAGSYNEIIPLKISSSQGYKVYYTMNGKDPVVDGELYEKPIFLEDGIYELRAICISEYGVSSDEIIMKYEVNFATK